MNEKRLLDFNPGAGTASETAGIPYFMLAKKIVCQSPVQSRWTRLSPERPGLESRRRNFGLSICGWAPRR